MSIWKDISKGATDAANYAAKKTGELTNLAKMKLNLHTEESKLTDCYAEIGKLYYDMQNGGKNADIEIRAFFSAVDASKRKIERLKAQIAEMQTTTVCLACGEKIPKDYAFCPICGKKLDKTENAEAEAEAEVSADDAE